MHAWREIEAGVYVRSDSCRVYAVRGPGAQWLIINAGSGSAAAALAALGSLAGAVLLLTHHFRDHTAGANDFRPRGVRVAAPWFERDHLAGEQRALRAKPTSLLYDLAWDHFAPVTPLSVDRWMMDYERTTLAGLEVEVVPTPAFTMGAVTYVVTLANGRRLAFVGELMCAPGRVARLSPLQYNYNDLTGAENVLHSWARVRATAPDLVLPSLGEPFTDVAAAETAWRANVARFEAVHPGTAERLQAPARVTLERVLPRLWRADGAVAETHFIVSRTGKVLALDYGYDARAVKFPARLDPWTRRPLLHSMEDLRALAGATRIDTVLPTHYHDDHVVGLPLLARLQGTEIWAPDNFADLLERPGDFDRPCLWPEPVRVTRRLPLGVPCQWEDVTLTLHPMTGHTEYSALICLELDGVRVAHTGDQLFFQDPATGRLVTPGQGGVFTNHVYRNGLAIGGYVDFVRRLQEFNPAWILSGHHRPYQPPAGLWARLLTAAQEFDRAHQAIMPLEAGAAHFGADSVAAKIEPYHLSVIAGGSPVPLSGWVLNPLPVPAEAELRFVVPAGWEVSSCRLPLRPRERTPFATHIVAHPRSRGRHPIALELVVAGQTFGQVAEAWVTIA